MDALHWHHYIDVCTYTYLYAFIHSYYRMHLNTLKTPLKTIFFPPYLQTPIGIDVRVSHTCVRLTKNWLRTDPLPRFPPALFCIRLPTPFSSSLFPCPSATQPVFLIIPVAIGRSLFEKTETVRLTEHTLTGTKSAKSSSHVMDVLHTQTKISGLRPPTIEE